MSAFRADLYQTRRVVAALGLVTCACAAVLLDLPAKAQDVTGGPIRLVPRDIPQSAPAPERPREGQVNRAGFSTTIPKQRIQGIEINPLAEIAPEAIGILGPDDGGFGIEMWRGTDRGVIESLLRRLPPNMSSRTLRALARRLLLSVAPPPPGDSRRGPLGTSAQTVAVRNTASPSGLLALRAERLAALGEIPALISLLSVVPARVDDESLDRLRVDALFLAHEQDEACRLVRNGIALHHALPHWQKAMVFCQMAAGELDRGMLGLDLLREQEVADDPVFFALANRFLGVTAQAPNAPILSPLQVAMLRASGAPFAPDVLEAAAPGLLFAIANAPNAEAEQRADAAERAGAKGLLDGEVLARGYASLSFTPEQLGNAIGAAETLQGVRTRALLYQAARNETLPATRAEVLRVALDRAARAGLYQAVVPVFAPLIAGIEPAPQMAWFAATAGRALYAAGRHPEASAWLALGRQEAIINPQASAAVAALWPYSRLAGGAALTTDGTLATWHAMREGTGSAPSGRSLGLLRAAFQALGERDPLPWSDIAAAREAVSNPMPDAALIYALDDASEARRVGETLLLSLIVLGEGGPAESHTLALGAALSALTRIGLDSEARALAIEAALAAGV